MKRTTSWTALWIVLFACSCSGGRREARAPAAPAAADLAPAVQSVESGADPALEEGRRLHREGLQLFVDGEIEDARYRMREARSMLLEGANACTSDESCDIEPYLQAFFDLLLAQEEVMGVEYHRAENIAASIVEEPAEAGTSPFVAAMPEIGRTQFILRGSDLRELIPFNGPVQAALDDWLTWKRPLLMEAWENYLFLRSRIAPIYEEAGLPEALLFAMIATETGGKAHAVSSAGAAGLLQFMPYTGRIYGLDRDGDFDQRFDPVLATRANVAYLDAQFKVLNDNLEKALAAYNGGEGRMRNIQRRHGRTSLWDPAIYYSLPRETRAYVPSILATAYLFLHPEEFNLELPQRDVSLAELTLQRGTSLSELTVCLGQVGGQERGWFRTLRNLNPRVEPGDRLEAGDRLTVPVVVADAYPGRCLQGEILARAEEIHAANYPPEPEVYRYRVQSGDTLNSIASRHRCVSMRQLASMNDISAPSYVIRVGQSLKIPRC